MNSPLQQWHVSDEPAPNPDASLSNLVQKKQWRLLRPNGDVRSPLVRFLNDGRIVGYEHVNEAGWKMDGQSLLFCHADGTTTARAGAVAIDSNGQYRIAMLRADSPDAVAHVLIERNPLVDLLECASLDQLWRALKAHPCFEDGALLTADTLTPPGFAAPEFIEVLPSTIARLAAMGIRCHGPIGARNAILVDKHAPPLDITLHFNGNCANLVILDPNSRLRGHMNFLGDQNVAIVGEACAERDIHLSAEFRYGAAALRIGKGASAGHLNVWIEGPGRSIQIGDDLMSSWGVWLRTADSHGLVDLASGSVVNPSRSITIGPHVWLAQDVIVMPGVSIGGGSIVGARSIVTKSLPACCVGAGAPARIVRRNASWTRDAHPSETKISALRSEAAAWLPADQV